ncbi:MAG: DMT family transporter [Lachnospiraceae bacterium]|nr:DMT family transporter [Lachnospiraceae bacterium]
MSTAQAPKDDHLKGFLCILSAALGFSLMTFFVRLSGELPTMQKAFFRNIVAAVVASVLILRSEDKFRIKKGSAGDIFWRCAFGTSGLIANFYAIDRLGLSDANILNKLSPFFAILVSIPVMKEVPGTVDIIATVVAFIGAVFIIRPGQGLSTIPALIGLYGGFGAGTAYAFVRRLGKKGERTEIIVFCFSAFSCLVTAPFLIFGYVHMEAWQLLSLIAAGVAASLGQFSITTAYRFAPARELSVFDYTQVIFAAVWGMIFFDEKPVMLSIIGYVIIIGTAVVRWWLNLRKEKK